MKSSSHGMVPSFRRCRAGRSLGGGRRSAWVRRWNAGLGLVGWLFGALAACPASAVAQVASAGRMTAAEEAELLHTEAIETLMGRLTDVAYSRTPLSVPVALYDKSFPAEEIRVRKTREGLRLQVTVNYVRRGFSRRMATEAPLPPEDWERLVELIVDQDLIAWEPATSESSHSTQIDELEFDAPGLFKQRPLWYHVIDNPSGPSALREALVQLADEHAPRLRVIHLR